MGGTGVGVVTSVCRCWVGLPERNPSSACLTGHERGLGEVVVGLLCLPLHRLGRPPLASPPLLLVDLLFHHHHRIKKQKEKGKEKEMMPRRR